MSGQQNDESLAIQGDWIERFVPAKARPYARLLRLDHPEGAWLLLLPCLWSACMASSDVPDFSLLLLFVIGSVVMRGAGCVVNDIYDRDFDRKVERTKGRPLASGALEVWQALLLLVFVLLIGSCILFQFNRFTKALGMASLVLVFVYPLAKRVTWWPQLVLGLAFNWGALLGWSSVKGGLSLPAVLLYVGGVFWTLAYDTIYAHQDKRDDVMAGVKSLALRLGKKSRVGVALFFFCALSFFATAGIVSGEGWGFYLIYPFAVAHVVWQLWGWQMDNDANCAERFQSNRDFGLIVLAAIVAGKYF